MRNPCYDIKTHTDCPRRAVGCSANCPDWAKYETERNHEYKERYKKTLAYQDVSAIGPGRLKTYRDIATKKLYKINNN